MIRKTGAHGRAKLILFAVMLAGFSVGPGAVTSAYAEVVNAVMPQQGSTGVCVGTAVTVQLSNGVDPTTANANGLQLVGPGSVQVPAQYNTDGAYSNVTLQPVADLAPNTTYTVRTTSALKSPAGNSYTPNPPFDPSTFTTGTAQCAPRANVSFSKSILDSSGTAGPTALALGPNPNNPTQLWAAFGSGLIRVYNLDPSTGKTLGSPSAITSFSSVPRIISGLRFAPSSTAGDIKLWVSNAQGECDLAAIGLACTNFTGAVSTLTGPNPGALSKTDIVTGLPRSVGDHMNNGIDFGPDGALYLAQGANNGYGAPDPIWGNREEVPLSATVLRIDINSITSVPYSVNTSTGYDYTAPNARVKPYVTGIRNPYSVVWHSNGRLYAPVNESASGNTPASPAQANDVARPALNDLPAFNDYFTQVVPGKYYGHPNPSRNEFRLNGGNPTAGADPFQVSQYDVGTQPNINWRKPDLDLGQHRSANGSAEYKSGVFGAELQGKVLVTEYSQGKDIIAVRLDGNGTPVSTSVVAAGFYNPLPLVTDNNGRIYVGEYGRNPDGEGGRLTLLTPNAPGSPKACTLKNKLKISLRNAKRHRFTKLVVYVNGKKVKTVKSKKLGKGKKTKSFTITLPTTRTSKIKIVGSRAKAKKRTYKKTFKPSCS